MLNGTTIQYGPHVIDFGKVPLASIENLLRGGVAHKLGNEVSARVTAWKDSVGKEAIKALVASNAQATDAEKKAAYDGAQPTEAAIEAQKLAFQNETIADIYSGELGAGRGPRLDPVERELNTLVDNKIANKLAGAGIKFPKGRKLPAEGEVVNFANGVTRTLEEMRKNVLAAEGDALRKDAQKRVDDQARKAAKAKEEAAKIAAQGPVSAEALGI